MSLDDDAIKWALDKQGFNQDLEQGKLLLVELLVKAQAGYYNSNTEEGLLVLLDVLKKDRTMNKKGSRFLCDMVYSSSNKRAKIYDLIGRYRF